MQKNSKLAVACFFKLFPPCFIQPALWLEGFPTFRFFLKHVFTRRGEAEPQERRVIVAYYVGLDAAVVLGDVLDVRLLYAIAALLTLLLGLLAMVMPGLLTVAPVDGAAEGAKERVLEDEAEVRDFLTGGNLALGGGKLWLRAPPPLRPRDVSRTGDPRRARA